MAERDPGMVEGLATIIGANAAPPRDTYFNLGPSVVDPDLARIARARAQEVRAAFEEGVEMGSGGLPPAYPVAQLWRRSKTLKRLAGGSTGFDVVGVWATCSDPRAAGRSYWRVNGAWRGRAWVQSVDRGVEPVDLIVSLETLKRCIDATPLVVGAANMGGCLEMEDVTAGRWCILRTGGQRTIALMRSLEAAGIDAWTPVEARKRRRPRSKKQIEIEIAMMPTFVFARADRARELAAICRNPASPHPHFSLFHHQGRVPLVSSSDVERLRAAERRQAPKERRRVFAAGAAVRVPEGPFGGMSGIVRQGNDRYTLVAFNGRFEVKISTFLLLDDAVQMVKPDKGAPAGSAMVS